jgi:hypothetical protein
MKVLFNNQIGFSLVEIILAIAIGSMLLTSMFVAVQQIDEGLIWSRWRFEAYQFLVGKIKSPRSDAFYATSTPADIYIHNGQVVDPALCTTQSCLEYAEQIVSDATCGQKRLLSASFEIRPATNKRYVHIPLYELNSSDVIRRGGDCPWLYQSQFGTPAIEISALGNNYNSLGIDVFEHKLVVVGSSSPQLRVYESSVSDPGTYEIKTFTVGDGRRINAVDVVRHQPSGRWFAYVVFHDRSNQLGVFELFTDNREPALLVTRTLWGAIATGSFPQGWRLIVYGERLYVLTRETAGTELHMFSLSDPAAPVEDTSSRTELSRTVNDMDILGRIVAGEYKEYLILGASAALKEFAIFDVTGVVPVEILAINLPGTSNVEALYVTSEVVYLGRQVVTGGPELYQYAISDLLAGSTTPRATYEVGTGVTNIAGIGGELVVTTSRSPSDVDRYSNDVLLWQTNNARLSRVAYQGMLPYASDRTDTGVVLLRRTSAEESLINIHTP